MTLPVRLALASGLASSAGNTLDLQILKGLIGNGGGGKLRFLLLQSQSNPLRPAFCRGPRVVTHPTLPSLTSFVRF